MNKNTCTIFAFIWAAIVCLSPGNIEAQNNTLSVEWDNILSESKTTATLQLVENPKVRPGSSIHKNVFKSLKELGADYVRYVPWFPYAKMSVAQLKRPTKTETYWDFTYLDSTMAAFMEATNGHPVVINFSTTPAWVWETAAEVAYPEDAYKPFWNYNQGTTLKDPSLNELADYYVRLFSWYTKGGFTDELGQYHKSGHYYKIPYWEVLNEPDLEHKISPQLYTKIYDAIVGKLKKISPETKFVGISVAFTSNPEYFEYFLNKANHKPGIPLDAISYHHYSSPSFEGQTLEAYQYTFFEKADAFLDKVRYIENIRKRLAPNVATMINELGVILRSPEVQGPIDDYYWNLAGAMYAHIFLELTKMGIDVVGESQLVGYPTQFPDVSMVNWNTGQPNARYWVLKLLINNIRPGDKLVNTNISAPGVVAQAFLSAKSKKVLLINKTNRRVQIKGSTEFNNARISYVDITTSENPPINANVSNGVVTLEPFAVVVLEI